MTWFLTNLVSKQRKTSTRSVQTKSERKSIWRACHNAHLLGRWLLGCPVPMRIALRGFRMSWKALKCVSLKPFMSYDGFLPKVFPQTQDTLVNCINRGASALAPLLCLYLWLQLAPWNLVGKVTCGTHHPQPLQFCASLRPPPLRAERIWPSVTTTASTANGTGFRPCVDELAHGKWDTRWSVALRKRSTSRPALAEVAQNSHVSSSHARVFMKMLRPGNRQTKRIPRFQVIWLSHGHCGLPLEPSLQMTCPTTMCLQWHIWSILSSPTSAFEANRTPNLNNDTMICSTHHNTNIWVVNRFHKGNLWSPICAIFPW